MCVTVSDESGEFNGRERRKKEEGGRKTRRRMDDGWCLPFVVFGSPVKKNEKRDEFKIPCLNIYTVCTLINIAMTLFSAD